MKGENKMKKIATIYFWIFVAVISLALISNFFLPATEVAPNPLNDLSLRMLAPVADVFWPKENTDALIFLALIFLLGPVLFISALNVASEIILRVSIANDDNQDKHQKDVRNHRLIFFGLVTVFVAVRILLN